MIRTCDSILCKFCFAVTFKLVYDRETGKPKGYGFCEYKDQETALSAMRNLNGVEIAGRTLRVDNACTEKSRMEIQSLMAEPVTERYYNVLHTIIIYFGHWSWTFYQINVLII